MNDSRPRTVPSLQPPSYYWLLVGVGAVVLAFLLAYPNLLITAGDRIAAVTLFVAELTLIGVGMQLRLAEKELKAVKDDFNLSQKMYDASNRRANLDLEFLEYGHKMNFGYFQGKELWQQLNMNLLITNKNGRSIKPIMLNLYIDPRISVKLFGFTEATTPDPILGRHYYLEIDRMMYENHMNVAPHTAFQFCIPLTFDIKYRIVCADGIFPESGPGTLSLEGQWQ